MNEQLTFAPADDCLWEQYEQLATRAYGHPVGDITHLREHADLKSPSAAAGSSRAASASSSTSSSAALPSPAPASATAAWLPRNAASTWPPTWSPNDCAP